MTFYSSCIVGANLRVRPGLNCRHHSGKPHSGRHIGLPLRWSSRFIRFRESTIRVARVRFPAQCSVFRFVGANLRVRPGLNCRHHSGKPHSGKPHSGKPHSGKPHSGKPHSGRHIGLPLRWSGEIQQLIPIIFVLLPAQRNFAGQAFADGSCEGVEFVENGDDLFFSLW